jgi:hypothetical protein
MAADQIFPIILKAGILRDRPKFQGEYCTDGQWIRFYGGMPKKIGGMTGLKTELVSLLPNGIYIHNVDNTKYTLFTGYSGAIEETTSSRVSVSTVNNNVIAPVVHSTVIKSNAELLWQFIPVVNSVNATKSYEFLVCFGANNLTNILDTSAPQIWYIPLTNAGNGKLLKPIPTDTNGGMVFSNPYLFAYGNNGLVRWSKTKDPLVFDNSKRSVNISTDKVIFGAKVRGGNSPTLLFWTLSSVIKLSNDGTGEGDSLEFNKDVITSDSSILSTRCVVEYDGVFYWPGTGRFFIYNGIVNPLENNTNRNYFFDNLDMKKRQLVFGVKNVAKDEIWWFYPEKNRGIGVGCTHAIIYNVIENSWYDTQISRDSGFWDNVTGNMYTAGKSLTVPDNANNFLFKHEINVNETLSNQGEQGANTIGEPIISSFTTPTVSFASFNPLKQLTGIDRWMQLKKIEPDFKMHSQDEQLTVTINSKEYAQSPTISSDVIEFTGDTPKIDYYYQGRQLTFTFASTNYFEMGHVMITVNLGDGQ